jgi:hypothetical protein
MRAQIPKARISRRAKQLAAVLNGDWMPSVRKDRAGTARRLPDFCAKKSSNHGHS